MLGKNDLKGIADIVNNAIDTRVPPIVEKIVDKQVAKHIGDFFHDTLAPYLDEKFKENDNDHDAIFRKLDQIDDHVANHKQKIKKLETLLNS